MQTPAFAMDRATRVGYEQRAGEYDEWYTGESLFAHRDRPGWSDEVATGLAVVSSALTRRGSRMPVTFRLRIDLRWKGPPRPLPRRKNLALTSARYEHEVPRGR